MNNFAHIKPLFKYKTVAYYSVCLDDNEKTLYQEFVKKHTVENEDKLYHIQKWLKLIGEKYGAQNRFFRNEARNHKLKVFVQGLQPFQRIISYFIDPSLNVSLLKNLTIQRVKDSVLYHRAHIILHIIEIVRMGT